MNHHNPQPTEIEILEERERRFERYLRSSTPLTEEEAALFYASHTQFDFAEELMPETGRAMPSRRVA